MTIQSVMSKIFRKQRERLKRQLVDCGIGFLLHGNVETNPAYSMEACR
eukprot:CAMPEP_0172504504 /NCGR_PEP_ID=MMETSP1066-20121228/179306_1 /TAXON_ID=671091 /ORGANISM="Coscinodiscus wailesii, Strain CCMP2513" /LENGTH=47 /DNA_ID= /DNA_START= /DNA_END= /DNA_ORIENTATION=